MTFDQSQNESSHAEALTGGEARRCTRREPRRSVASGVANLQRFGVERGEQPVSQAGRGVHRAPWPNRVAGGV